MYTIKFKLHSILWNFMVISYYMSFKLSILTKMYRPTIKMRFLYLISNHEFVLSISD